MLRYEKKTFTPNVQPYTHDQVSQIRTELKELLEIIDNKDAEGMKGYLTKIRNNVKRDIEIKKQ